MSFYANATVGMIACVTSLLGCVVGSFAGALLVRLPAHQSVVGPRSHCPQCGHVLGPMDLVPVLSYLWLRGRCRYCSLPISPQYAALEASCGVTAGIAGALGGWAGGLLAIGAWIAVAVGVGLLRRGGAKRERGFTLVEVLVAMLLLTLAAGSLFETIRVGRSSVLAAQRRTVAVAQARQTLAQVAADAAVRAPTSTSLHREGEFDVATVVEPFRTPHTYLVTVYVCTPGKCSGSPPKGAEVKLTEVVCRCKRI